MKGNKKLLIVAVLLLLVAVSYTTYAIYRTNLTGNATVTAAKWSAVIKKSVGGTDTALTGTIALTGTDFVCTGGHAKVAGKIAPGDTCTATLVADLDESEVDAKVGVTLTTTDVNNRFTVSLTDENGTAVTSGDEIAVPYSATAGGMEKTFKVVIAWDDTDSDAVNPTDTNTLANTDITIPVTLTAHQDMTTQP